MSKRWLTALPVFNEASSVDLVLAEVRNYSKDILVIDDGSTDGTAELLARQPDLNVVSHPENRGYGAALRSAFCFAIRKDYEIVVTIDCDGQHEPQRIPQFVSACEGVDIVSGSRYLQQFPGDDAPPSDRRWINEQITFELNRRLGLHLTDAFCGFKAYRVDALRKLRLVEDGYAMPLELWVQAAQHRLVICERAVPLIYLDEKRSFGGLLNDSNTRLDYYHDVLERSIADINGETNRPLARVCGDNAG
jgi:dolichol-phosphate mannosyltransferase